MLEDANKITYFAETNSRGKPLPFGIKRRDRARHALLLDGGISGQLMLRSSDGSVRSWPGSRAVPLGLEARTR